MIEVKKLYDTVDRPPKIVTCIIFITKDFMAEDSMIAFKELIQRGANLWPDAPPEIKSFADLITNGEVLQDYALQDTSSNRKKSVS
jgi:hypothetical protein